MISKAWCLFLSVCVGLARSQTFSTVAGDPARVTFGFKYNGAAASGTKAAFAPFHENVIGVYDASTNAFTTVASSPVAATHYQLGGDKFEGAAAVGTKVVFAPSLYSEVGIFDLATNGFSTVATTGEAGTGCTCACSAGRVGGVCVMLVCWNICTFRKYAGAAALGTKVYFAPGAQNNAGVFDVATSTFSTIDNNMVAAQPQQMVVIGGGYQYNGAVAIGTNIIFAPEKQVQ